MPRLRNTRHIAALITALLLSLPNIAGEHSKLTLNGISSYQTLNSEYYIAALYVQTPSKDAEVLLHSPGLKRMKIIISKDKWRSRNFAQTWLNAININTDPATQKKQAKHIFAFTQIAKNTLLMGDEIIIDHTPGSGSRVSLNGKSVLLVKNDEYFSLLLQSWIGQRPPSSTFKDQILANDDKKIQAHMHEVRLAGEIRLSKQKALAQHKAEQRKKAEAARIAKQIEEQAALVASAPATTDTKARPFPVRDKVFQIYQQNITRLAQAKMIYPTKSMNENQQGKVWINITLNRDGAVELTELSSKTPYIALNNAAEKAARTASYPPLPEQLDDNEEFSIEVVFSL